MRLTLHMTEGETVRIEGASPKSLDLLTNALQVGSALVIKGSHRTVWVDPRQVITASFEEEEA